MLVKIHMSAAHEDTHVICSCRYTCQMLMQIHMSYAMKIHMSAAYLLGCLMLCSCRYTCQLLTCWAA